MWPSSNIPSNVHFEIHNAETEWYFAAPGMEEFDFIHGRVLAACFADPKSVFSRIIAKLKPGGYFEMQDCAFPFQWASPPPADCALL
jgi:chemotaxis methyl-accepting protein methylase